MNTILIQIPGCNEFTEKFPGGSPNAAIELAAIRYPNALRIEWKGTCRSDAEESAAAARNARWEQQTQNHYARQSAQTASTWKHQRDLDARDHAAPSYAHRSGAGIGLRGAAVVFALFLGFATVNTGIQGAATFFEGFADGFTEQVR